MGLRDTPYVRDISKNVTNSDGTSREGTPEANFGGRGSKQARDLERTKVVWASCFTPGLKQATLFVSKSFNHRLIVVHAMNYRR